MGRPRNRGAFLAEKQAVKALFMMLRVNANHL
jgi:hypothetical protein